MFRQTLLNCYNYLSLDLLQTLLTVSWRLCRQVQFLFDDNGSSNLIPSPVTCDFYILLSIFLTCFNIFHIIFFQRLSRRAYFLACNWSGLIFLRTVSFFESALVCSSNSLKNPFSVCECYRHSTFSLYIPHLCPFL